MDKKINKEILRDFFRAHRDDLDNNNFERMMEDALDQNLYDDAMYVLTEAKISVPSGITALPSRVHLDTIQMPPYLRSERFAIWINKFNRLLERIGLSAWRYVDMNVTVRFSDERKTESFGSLTVSELKDIIRRTWDRPRKSNLFWKK